jgi:hypothetical protein
MKWKESVWLVRIKQSRRGIHHLQGHEECPVRVQWSEEKRGTQQDVEEESSKSAHGGEWERHWSTSQQKTYYRHPLSGLSRWSLPKGAFDHTEAQPPVGTFSLGTPRCVHAELEEELTQNEDSSADYDLEREFEERIKQVMASASLKLSAGGLLPAGWSMHWSRSHHAPYYYHMSDGVSSWSLPNHTPAPIVSAKANTHSDLHHDSIPRRHLRFSNLGPDAADSRFRPPQPISKQSVVPKLCLDLALPQASSPPPPRAKLDPVASTPPHHQQSNGKPAPHGASRAAISASFPAPTSLPHAAPPAQPQDPERVDKGGVELREQSLSSSKLEEQSLSSLMAWCHDAPCGSPLFPKPSVELIVSVASAAASAGRSICARALAWWGGWVVVPQLACLNISVASSWRHDATLHART